MSSRLEIEGYYLDGFFRPGWWKNILNQLQGFPFNHSAETTYDWGSAKCFLSLSDQGVIQLNVWMTGRQPGALWNFGLGVGAVIDDFNNPNVTESSEPGLGTVEPGS